MDITISPGSLRGKINIIPSKSQAHRLLICSAFADKETTLHCKDTNRDIEATADCLRGIGAEVTRTETAYHVKPCQSIPQVATLNCCESGSTLRFMLPIVGALGIDATFLMEGRLPQRPLSPLWEEMERMGCRLTRPTENTLRCEGKLAAGDYSISGSVSSQYITGLLFALSLVDGKSTLTVTGKLESKPYIDLTKNALHIFGIDADDLGKQTFRSPGEISVEGDWSNGAFFCVANAMGSRLDILGLDEKSSQGDRAVVEILQRMEQGFTVVDAADIPDLVPVLSIAAYKNGAEFRNIARLRLKESDRVASVCGMVQALGGRTEATENTLIVYPAELIGGKVDACGDHRIAMSAAIAATFAKGEVTIEGAECVSKSYPKFWEEYKRLGGSYEQHIR